jgi:hypothetical protein
MRLPHWLRIPHINFWIPEPAFMKLYTYIMVPEPITQRRASQIPPLSLCVCMCIPLSLLGNGLVKTLRRQRIHTQQ